VFQFDSSKIASYCAITASRLGLPSLAAQAFDRTTTSAHSPKQAAVVAVEQARSLAAGGHLEQACVLAVAAHDVGGTYHSERVRQAVREFRASLGGPAAAAHHRRTRRPAAQRLCDGEHLMRIAITGHRGLPAATEQLVDQAIRAQLATCTGRDIIGVSNLADGADQLFAQAVLDAGGQLDVIIPAAHYRDGLPECAHASYDKLLSKASSVHRLDRVESTEEAHMEASNLMLDTADRLFAVWDGKPARGYGGTADVVAEARKRGIPVTIIWPEGATRDEAA
jgi:hypothetical protein